MEHLWAFPFPQLAQEADKFHYVVPVEWTEIADVHALEHVLLLTDGGFQRIGEPNQAVPTVVGQKTLATHPFGNTVAHVVVGLVGVEAQQVLLHAAHRAVDAHVVVVEDDEHVVGRRRDVVQSFKGQAAAHGAIANHRHHLPLLVGEFGGHGHAEGGRDGVGGVAAGEGVVFALGGGGEGAKTMEFAVRAKLVAPPCKNLVPIGLVPHVPHDAVFGRVVYVMQRHGQFHYAQTGGQMPGIHRQFVDDVVAQLLAELGQFFHFQLAQVGRALDGA